MSEQADAHDHPSTANSVQDFGREFKLYITAQAVSVVGDRVAIIALTFLVIKLSNSFAPALAVYFVCRLLPTLIGGLLVGVFVDRYNRRHLMVGCDVGRAVLLAAVPSLGALTLWTLYPIVVVLYAFTIVFETAARAALPDVIPESRMIGANAIIQGIENGGDLAYVVGGALIYLFSLQAPFYLDAATFLVSALCVFAMRVPSIGAGKLSSWKEVPDLVRGGFTHLWGNPFLKWSTIVLGLAPVAGGAAFVLTPLFAQHALGHGSTGPLASGAFRYSLLQSGEAVGAVLGTLLAGRLASRMPLGALFGIGVTGTGLADGSLGFVSSIYPAMAALLVAGFFNSLFIICGVTLVQTLTPTEVRGRAFAARYTVVNTALALGAGLGGVLLLVFSYRGLWFLEGAVIVLSSLFVWLIPEVRGQP
ncbi:MAG TPA: MFS transporter [Chloroflexota bacterium]|jgi:MFS family permease